MGVKLQGSLFDSQLEAYRMEFAHPVEDGKELLLDGEAENSARTFLIVCPDPELMVKERPAKVEVPGRQEPLDGDPAAECERTGDGKRQDQLQLPAPPRPHREEFAHFPTRLSGRSGAPRPSDAPQNRCCVTEPFPGTSECSDRNC